MSIIEKNINKTYTYLINLINNDNLYNILNVCIVFITIIVVLDIMKIQLKNNNSKTNYLENFKSSEDILINKEIEDPKERHDLCSKMTNNTCKYASYCVLLDNSKCVGGSEIGPTYLTDGKKKIDYMYYTHKNKCYGECPK